MPDAVPENINGTLRIRHFEGLQPYEPVLAAMQHFTNTRLPETADEIWLLQHHPVLTQGQAGKKEHIIGDTNIPVIQTDRGGQVTYHGPGQLVAYLLLNIKRRKMNVRELVSLIESCIINTLHSVGITACTKPTAPGVYVQQGNSLDKIASLGLRIRKGCSYHGLALNIDMDSHVFDVINPCGYPGLKVASIADCIEQPDWGSIENLLLENLCQSLDIKETLHSQESGPQTALECSND